MQFSEMKTEIWRRLEETESSPVFWTESEVAEAINEGYHELADATEWYERSITLFFRGNQTYYNLRKLIPDEFLLPSRAQNDTTNWWMQHETYRDLDKFTYVKWEDNLSDPKTVFYRGLWWLGTHPKPSTTEGSMTYWYKSIPPPLSADRDEPSLPRDFHWIILDFAMYDLLAQAAETDKALIWWRKYQEGEEILRRYVKQRVHRDRVGRMGG